MWKNKLYSFLLIMVLGVSTVTDSSIGAGGCGGNDTPIVEEEPIPIPDPEGNWMDDGNYDTTWYYNGENELSTAKQLAGLAKLVNDGTDNFENKTVVLVRNIDLKDHYWTPIGLVHASSPFAGTFDGRNYTVSNIIMKSQNPDKYDYGGLFGVNLGTIKNTKVKDVSISVGKSGASNWSIAGGLAGYNFTGTITNCTATGSVSASSNGWDVGAGGLVGLNRGGTIRGCKDVNVAVHVEVIGAVGDIKICAGGFIGYNDGAGTITNCSAISANISSIVEGHAVNTSVKNARGKFAGCVENNSTLSGNRADGSPKIGWDEKKSPPGPGDDI